MEITSEPAYIVRDGTIDSAKLNLEVCLRSSITRVFIEVLNEGITGTTFEELYTKKHEAVVRRPTLADAHSPHTASVHSTAQGP